MATNEKILKSGFEKAEKIKAGHLISCLRDICIELLRTVAYTRHGWVGWSGNTQLSYMCGIYYHGRLVEIVNQENWHEPVRRRKLLQGKWAYLKNPYEGKARSIRGEVETDGGYGYDTSYRFLHTYHLPKDTIGIVMTTGTEHSEYIEVVRQGDVLTGIFERASKILKGGFKPMEE